MTQTPKPAHLDGPVEKRTRAQAMRGEPLTAAQARGIIAEMETQNPDRKATLRMARGFARAGERGIGNLTAEAIAVYRAYARG